MTSELLLDFPEVMNHKRWSSRRFSFITRSIFKSVEHSDIEAAVGRSLKSLCSTPLKMLVLVEAKRWELQLPCLLSLENQAPSYKNSDSAHGWPLRYSTKTIWILIAFEKRAKTTVAFSTNNLTSVNSKW